MVRPLRHDDPRLLSGRRLGVDTLTWRARRERIEAAPVELALEQQPLSFARGTSGTYEHAEAKRR
jgi:hypothetical protein